MEHDTGRETAHLGSAVLLHDVEGRQFHVEAEGAISALSHDVEVDGVGFDAFFKELHLLAVGGGIFGFGAAVSLDADDGTQREEEGAVQESAGLPLDKQGHGKVYGFQPREVEVGPFGTGHNADFPVLLDKVAVLVHDIVAPVDTQTGDESPVIVAVNRGTDGDEVPEYLERTREVERDPVGVVEEPQSVTHAVAEAEAHARPVGVEAFALLLLVARDEVGEGERYRLGEFPRGLPFPVDVARLVEPVVGFSFLEHLDGDDVGRVVDLNLFLIEKYRGVTFALVGPEGQGEQQGRQECSQVFHIVDVFLLFFLDEQIDKPVELGAPFEVDEGGVARRQFAKEDKPVFFTR